MQWLAWIWNTLRMMDAVVGVNVCTITQSDAPNARETFYFQLSTACRIRRCHGCSSRGSLPQWACSGSLLIHSWWWHQSCCPHMEGLGQCSDHVQTCTKAKKAALWILPHVWMIYTLPDNSIQRQDTNLVKRRCCVFRSLGPWDGGVCIYRPGKHVNPTKSCGSWTTY